MERCFGLLNIITDLLAVYPNQPPSTIPTFPPATVDGTGLPTGHRRRWAIGIVQDCRNFNDDEIAISGYYKRSSIFSTIINWSNSAKKVVPVLQNRTKK